MQPDEGVADVDHLDDDEPVSLVEIEDGFESRDLFALGLGRLQLALRWERRHDSGAERKRQRRRPQSAKEDIRLVGLRAGEEGESPADGASRVWRSLASRGRRSGDSRPYGDQDDREPNLHPHRPTSLRATKWLHVQELGGGPARVLCAATGFGWNQLRPLLESS
jgi:hypothetical protein